MSLLPNFPTPHCHPQSFDSASTPEAFAARELELGTGSLTVTDHGSMGACRHVYDLAKSKGLTPILGVEAYFRDDDCPILRKHGIEKPAEYLKYYHITIHCLDEAAYSVLSQRLSRARIERHGSEIKPLFNWEDLEAIGAQNVTITSGCLVGMIQRHILRDGLELNQRWAIAEDYYQRLRSITRPGNWYVEVFPHKCDKNWVTGVFATTVDSAGVEEKVRFWESKKLRFQIAGELHAEEAARLWSKGKLSNDKIVAIMNNRKWVDQEPREVKQIVQVEDFLENECQPWCPNGDVQGGCNQAVILLANKYKDKIIISDDSHYATPDEKVVQDIRLQQMGNWRFYGHYHRQTTAEALQFFRRSQGTSDAVFEGWLNNNMEWAAKFKDFHFDSKPSLPTKFYPAETLKHTFSLIRKHGRMDWNNTEYINRLYAEIELLHRNGTIDLLPYFFIDEDVTSFYERIGMLTGPGRGSAAGLLLTYLLGITHVDPLKFGLSMDRFLTKDRIRSGKLPDVDQDLSTRSPLVEGWEEKVLDVEFIDGEVRTYPFDVDTNTLTDVVEVRERSIAHKPWLEERFGDHFAQISINTTLKLRSSVKDVARAVHGRVPDIVEALTKRFQKPPQGVSDYDFVFGYEDAGTWHKGSIEKDQGHPGDEALQEYARLFPRDWEVVQKCLGLSRQKGRHPCAYVIADRPIAEFLPLQEISGYQVTQYTAPSVEASGGLKMDFLVINSLNDLQDAIKIIQKRSGIEIPKEMVINGRRVPGIRLVPFNGQFYDIWDLPEDQSVFRDVAEGRTETVFQFNTPGAVQWLAHFNQWKNEAEGRKAIDSIEALSAFTALDRPGPLDIEVEGPDGEKHNMLVEYARRARGEPPIGALPGFLELLPETYGVMVYQEQLQKMYQQLTGCTGPEAEEFRTNVAKKKFDKILKAYKPWMERVAPKFGEKVAHEIWEFFKSWGQYGFNKSHAVAYVHISYACAFLKHHFSLEWWCAVLRNASKNEINESFWPHIGHLIDLPNVTVPTASFEIINERLQAPLSLLVGVGPGAHSQLMRYLPYTDIQDFCNKLEAHSVDNATPVLDADGKEIWIEKGPRNKKFKVRKMKRAHNALTRTVCYKLIVAGAMDGLFPKTTVLDFGDGVIHEEPISLDDKLMGFEKALSVAKKQKKPKPVKAEYFKLGPFQRYQLKKSAIPAYTENLLQIILETKALGGQIVKKPRLDGQMSAHLKYGNLDIKFLSVDAIRLTETINPWPPSSVEWAACAAYVLDQRTFWDGKACELELDVNGDRLTLIAWAPKPRDDTAPRVLDAVYRSNLKGAIVVVALKKYREDRPFGLEDIIVVQKPIGDDDEEGEVSPGESNE